MNSSNNSQNIFCKKGTNIKSKWQLNSHSYHILIYFQSVPISLLIMLFLGKITKPGLFSRTFYAERQELVYLYICPPSSKNVIITC